MKNKIRVLLSGAGGAGTIELIKNLRASGRYWVAAVDANNYATGLYLADYGEIVPLVQHKDYFSCISKLVEKYSIDVYVPLIDEELIPAYEFAKKKGLKLILPRQEFTALVLNKYKMVKAFQKLGINCPDTYLDEEVTTQNFKNKMLLKPIRGRGSRGIAVIENQNDYEQYFTRQPYKRSEVMLQEYIGGEEYTVSAVVGASGWIYSIVPKKIIKKQGITYLSVTEKNPLIDEIVNKIDSNFKPNGPFNVQLKIFKGKPYILEVNPRFSTTLVHTIAAGVNEVDCIIQDFMGMNKTKKKLDFKDKLVMIRYLTQHYVLENELK